MSDSKPYKCPICNGARGERILDPAHWQPCMPCKGEGIVWSPPSLLPGQTDIKLRPRRPPSSGLHDLALQDWSYDTLDEARLKRWL